MAASMEKKIAELEMGLLHLQQNIDIPEITLIVHPEVAKIIKKAAESNVKPNVSCCLNGQLIDSSNLTQDIKIKSQKTILKLTQPLTFSSVWFFIPWLKFFSPNF